jgi:hypothetical protein
MSANNLVRGVAALAIFLVSLMAWAGQPSWVNGDSAEFSSDQYLLGRGVGSTEAEAQNRARGDLVTIFEVRIQVSNENTTTVAQSGKQELVTKQASQQVSAKTDKVINGISIAKIWRDPDTQDFHALAVLPRAQASASLREELKKIDDAVDQQMQTAQTASDDLLQLGGFVQALQTSIKRDGFQAMLKVVDPSGKGKVAAISQVSIQQQIADKLKSIKIAAEVTGGGAAEFSGLLKGGLAAAGFLATSPAQTDYLLNGKLILTDLGQREGWHWLRASVEIELIEQKTGRVRGSKIWPLKVSAQDDRTARSRIMQETEKLFNQELRSTILSFAAN